MIFFSSVSLQLLQLQTFCCQSQQIIFYVQKVPTTSLEQVYSVLVYSIFVRARWDWMLPKFWMWGWCGVLRARGKNNIFAPPSHKTLRSSIYPRRPRGDHKHKQSAPEGKEDTAIKMARSLTFYFMTFVWCVIAKGKVCCEQKYKFTHAKYRLSGNIYFDLKYKIVDSVILRYIVLLSSVEVFSVLTSSE